MPLSEYDRKRLAHINAGRPLPERKVYRIKPVSDKRAAKQKEQKESLQGGLTEKEKWFQARRKELTGRCRCGCARKSSKDDNINFRSSICHIFPQRQFKSVQFHPANWVERSFWSGCHTNMDNRSMDRWPQFADWDDIKERFYILAPLLTEKERAKKFYKHLEGLLYGTI